MVHVDQSELANPWLLDHVVHQQLDRSGSNFAVDQGQLVHVIRNWVLKNRQQLLDWERVQCSQSENQGFEVLHFGDAFDDKRELVSLDPAVVEEHSVDDSSVQELTSVRETLAVALTEVVVLETESFFVDLVENRQGHVEVFQAALHVLDARVDIGHLTLKLLEVLFDISLLQPLLVLDVVLESVGHVV